MEGATSPPAPRRRLPGDERRETVLIAAGRCFARGGYEGTTIERIAAAAGVTKPIVYRHFDSKQALYLALLSRHREDLPTFLDGVMLGPGEPVEASLRTVLEGWFAYVAQNSHAWEMLFRDRGGGEKIGAFRSEVTRRAREVIASAVAASGSGIPTGEVVPTAEALRSGLAGLALWSIDYPTADRSELVAVALRMSLAAFRPSGAGPAAE